MPLFNITQDLIFSQYDRGMTNNICIFFFSFSFSITVLSSRQLNFWYALQAFLPPGLCMRAPGPCHLLHWYHLTSSCLTAPSLVHPWPWFSRPQPATPERLLKVQWKCFSRRNSIMQNGKKLLDKRRQTSVTYRPPPPPPPTHTPFWDVTIKLISPDTPADSVITKIFSRQNGFKMS